MSTKEITIHDETFTVSAPYAEGQVITALEAKTLNQTRAENVANNFRKRVKAALEGLALKEGAEVESLDAVRAAFSVYDAAYTFSMPSAGREPIDPLDREILRIAKESVKKAISEAGKKLKDYDEDRLEAAYAKASENELVIKEAKRRLAAAAKNVEGSLADLGL